MTPFGGLVGYSGMDAKFPSPLPRITLDVLDRVLSGEGTAEEAEAVRRRFGQYPGLDELFADLGAYAATSATEATVESPGWEVMRARIAAADVGTVGAAPAAAPDPRRKAPGHQRKTVQRPRVSRALTIGIAAMVLLAGAGLGLRQHFDRFAALTFSRNASKEYATRVGESATITLADGSRVTLAPQSTLRIDENVFSSARAVTLRGEALFDVVASSRHPFTVRSGPSVTRVLGTTFTVRHYPGDAYARIIVTQGKVGVASVGRVDSALVLHDAMVAQVNDSATTAMRLEGVRQYVDWRTGRLIFHEVPMADVLSAMHRWYGYRFQLADSSLGSLSITAALDSRSPANAFATIKLLLGVDFTFEGNVVTVRQRRDFKVAPETRKAVRDSFTTFKGIGR
jgi:transmembrane sensor